MSEERAGKPVTRPGRRWNQQLLIALIGAYIAAWVLTAIDPSQSTGDGGPLTSAATLIFMAELGIILPLDWRGYWTLRGRIKGWLAVVIGLVFPITIGAYLVLAIGDERRERQAAALARPRRIAQLERDLGIVPGTEGQCRACGKPLQVGATYCAFCSSPVVERPEICPFCAATALPGASFCPDCGKPLGKTSSK